MEMIAACLEPERISYLIPKIYDELGRNKNFMKVEHFGPFVLDVIQKGTPLDVVLKCFYFI